MNQSVFTRGPAAALPERRAARPIMTLDRLGPGRYAYIIRLEGVGEVRRRLFDMGLTPHTPVKMDKLAPLGDPMLINLRGYTLCLRKAEARGVVVRIFDSNGDRAGGKRFAVGRGM